MRLEWAKHHNGEKLDWIRASQGLPYTPRHVSGHLHPVTVQCWPIFPRTMRSWDAVPGLGDARSVCVGHEDLSKVTSVHGV